MFLNNSAIFNWYKIAILPAASRPIIRILVSHFEINEKNLENKYPSFNFLNNSNLYTKFEKDYFPSMIIFIRINVFFFPRKTLIIFIIIFCLIIIIYCIACICFI